MTRPLVFAGDDPSEIATRAGHTAVGFTCDRYVRVFPEIDDGAAAELDRTSAVALLDLRNRPVVPPILEAAAAAIVATTTRSPIGGSERATGRWLPFLRLGTAVALTAAAFGALAAGASVVSLAGGVVGLLRNFAGMVGVGLLRFRNRRFALVGRPDGLSGIGRGGTHLRMAHAVDLACPTARRRGCGDVRRSHLLRWTCRHGSTRSTRGRSRMRARRGPLTRPLGGAYAPAERRSAVATGGETDLRRTNRS